MSPHVHLAFASAVAAAAIPTFLLYARWIDRDARATRMAGAPAADAAPDLPAPPDLFPPPDEVERIGLVLVHGIGEQTRFEHLSGQLRDLLRALRPGAGPIEDVTVEIAGSNAAALHAEQDSWAGGREASVVVLLRHRMGGVLRESRLFVHEVWWADVNERYSLAKQFRFWLWGLAVWAHPAHLRSGLGSASDVRPPAVPDGNLLWARTRLWLVGVFFAALGGSVGLVSLFVTRVFGLQPPRVLRTLVNYISAVKLYNQENRFGPGLFWGREDYLDSIGEPPRVSVRRRMIRAIADAACNGYHRWYVLGHSQGSVVAFNGLMETAYAWPGYLDEKRWRRLVRRGMAGPARPGWAAPVGVGSRPHRPAWAAPDAIVYRQDVFRRCCGLLTYGSPLEKFAAIWPALVPISKEPAFHDRAVWLNLYDELDPVSGRLLAFKAGPPSCCPPAIDQGYISPGPLLVTHMNYLVQRPGVVDAASQALRWMLTGGPVPLSPAGSAYWYGWESATKMLRRVYAFLTWFGVGLVLIVIASLLVPWLLRVAGEAIAHLWAMR